MENAEPIPAKPEPIGLAITAIDSIRINSLRSEVRDGRLLWVKERNLLALPVIAAANCFFRLSGNPVALHTSLVDWQTWEVNSYARVNGTEFLVFAEGKRTVCAEALPGESLCRHLTAGTLTKRMMVAAGREFRRVHGLEDPVYGGPWSHSDPHTGNVIFDPITERARLIDFETIHDLRLSPDERHADDLLVFLQDLIGRIDRNFWPEYAMHFLSAYDRPSILRRLRDRLVLPRAGMARLWWAIRTTYMKTDELRWRLDVLREAIL